MSFWQRLLDSNQALPFIMAKKLLANQQNQCVLLRVPQSLIFGLFGCQVYVRHVCPTMAQQVRYIQFCAVLRCATIHCRSVLPGRIAVPHPVVCQRPGICPLVRTVLPKERLKSMNIGIRGHIVRHEQLMPPPDGSFSIPQCLFGCCRRHRHAPDTSTLALDRQQSRPLPRLHGSRIKTAEGVQEKLERKGYDNDVETAFTQLSDLIGFRLVTHFVGDVYELVKSMKSDTRYRVVKEKDYIALPKPNGYRSYHVILECPFPEAPDGVLRVEIQLRTIAMDCWASLEYDRRKCAKGNRIFNFVRTELWRMTMKILYAEDELGLSMAVSEVLKMEGFEVTSVMDGLSADEILQKEHFDMVVLDIMMPGMEGTQVAENMRKRSDYTPVLLLTAKAETEDRIDGLNKGADDYLAKPFAMGELVARVKAMIRRNRDYQQTVLNLANVTLDLESNELSARSGSLILSVKEAKLLALFLEKESVSYSVEDIAGQVFQGEVSPEEITLYMAYLNNKLIQIHGNLQLVMKDDRICMEQKEESD